MTLASTLSGQRAIRIDDPSDPRLADYTHMRERDLVGREGRFIAEGAVVLEKLIAAGRHGIRSVLLAENRLEALAPRFAGLAADVPVYAAGQAVMDAIVGFPIHRGVLAVGERSEPAVEALLDGLPPAALVVGLVGISNHDNMGGLFRNAAAFGADAVLVDDGCCDPLYRKAIRVSVGAALTTPFARVADGAEMTRMLGERGFELLALSPGGQGTLSGLAAAPRQAALFGAEGPGLSDAVMARCRTVRIPMAGGFDSLNVATSAGIVLNRLAELRNGVN
ncbi:MAG: RNA methyltransferase [Phenylobacterium sp.]|nr:MAG: RNA methyltransferase [Phenylobacterium sp.]